MIRLFALIFIIQFFSACQEDEHGKEKYVYRLKNVSNVEVGIRINPKANLTGASVLKNNFILKPGEDAELLSADEQKDPTSYLHSVEIYNISFTDRYKILDMTHVNVLGKTSTLELWLPDPNSEPILEQNTNVRIYVDENSIYGFCPMNDLNYETFFFRTDNEFHSISKSSLPAGTLGFGRGYVSGQELIAFDVGIYSDKTRFIVSNTNGGSWTNFLNVDNDWGTDFMDADFISLNEGWFFTYNNWDSTRVYKISENTYNRIAVIKGFCVVDSKFIDGQKGYVLVNPKDNVMPSEFPATYILKTIDGGVSWSEPILVSQTEAPAKFFVFPSGKIVIMRNNFVEMHSSYYVSIDDGNTWTLKEAVPDGKIRDIQFISDQVGFIKTGNSTGWTSPTMGFLYKTTNGGETWSKISSGQLPGARIYFHDENIGLLQDLEYSKGQILYITHNGGADWKEVLYPYQYFED
jgi:hypothetical protein